MLANKKPWGYEFLAFKNDFVAIWHLVLDPWQETSLHCHPNKKTGLIVLEGGASINFLSGREKLFAGDKVIIRHGVFHKTKNSTNQPLHLFEIETPVKKTDIVRIDDKYGRANQPLNNEPTIEIQVPYLLTYTCDKDPALDGNSIPWNIGSCLVTRYFLSNNEYEPKAQYMILHGGFTTKEGVNISSPGDIISGENLNRFISTNFVLVDKTEVLEIYNPNL